MAKAFIAALALFCLPVFAEPTAAWRVARSEHFEIYAQSSDPDVRALLIWFEQLRAFFEQQSGYDTALSSPVHVIAFSSEQEYESYRLRSNSDAYSVKTGMQDYIVMGVDGPANFGIAAHEYAHLALSAEGLQQPPWLKEGLAEYFATLRIREHATELGGLLPGRFGVLQRRAWLPIGELMSISEESQSREDRRQGDVFYAESWALTEMMALSPDYAPGFRKFVGRIADGTPGTEALIEIYAKTADAVTGDLRIWLNQRSLPTVRLPEVSPGALAISVSDVSPLAARLLLAQVLLAAGEFDRAEASLTTLNLEAPDSAEISAALGIIALRKLDSEAARRQWKRAIDLGVTDAKLCYQYAILADQAGQAANDIRPVLERAIALQPGFDDAHYRLALLEKNAGRYDAALQQFQMLRRIPQTRAYAYWSALADTFNELGRGEEAQTAAHRAAAYATTAAERSHADQQAYIAQTDPSVRFARDASGRLQLVTTRMPHAQSDWNPFIEPQDDIHRVQGTLREIDCASTTTIRVTADGKVLTLLIPDLQHVQMRHAPPDFVCGPQTAISVMVEYAQVKSSGAEGVVRGMYFQ